MTETNRIEFKRELTRELDIEKEVVAFLNYREGGIIYIGMDDEGKPVGVKDIDGDMLKIKDRIRMGILPSPMGLFDVQTERIENIPVIKITIASGTEKPYYKAQYGMSPRGCYIRVGTAVEQMSPSMIEKTFARRTRNSLSVIESPKQNLTFEQLKIYYQEHGKTLNDQFAQSLNFLTTDGRYNLNAFLFADQNDITIKVAKFAGTDKSDLIENEEYGYCSIIKSCKAVLDKLNVENRTLARITYPFRQETRLIDADSLREAVINAFVHNDYSDLMSPAFYIYSDRLEIVSYGGLIDGMSKEELVSGCSRPRNREIMRIFKDVNLVEQLGTGMNRMMKAYTPDIFVVSPNFFHTVFNYNKLSENFGKDFGKGFTKGFINELTDRQQIILDLLHNDCTLTSQKISQKINVSSRTIIEDFKALQQSGFIRRVGSRKDGHWEIIVSHRD